MVGIYLDYDRVTRIICSAISILLSVAVTLFLIEIIHNVFYVAIRMVAAVGTLLVLPIVLAELVVAFGLPLFYRWAQDQFKLAVWFFRVTAIQTAVLGGSVLARTRLIAWLTEGTTEDILELVGPIYETAGWTLLALGAAAAVVAVYLNRRSVM